MTFLNEVTKKAWPRWGLGPDNQRAIFHCPGDVPPKWRLEVPLAGFRDTPPAAPAPAPQAAADPRDATIAELQQQLAALQAKKPRAKKAEAT